jgi:hypothetical protein
VICLDLRNNAGMRANTVRLFASALFLAIAGAGLSPAGAAVIITNYPPPNDNVSTNIDDGLAVAAGFTLPGGAAYSLTSATVRISADDTVTAFSAQLFGDGGAGPVAPALVTFTAPIIAAGPADYVLTPNAPFVLQPATTYWLVVRGEVPSGTFDLAWRASNPGVVPTGIATSAGYRQDNGDPPTLPTAGPDLQPTFQVDGEPVAPPIPTLAHWGLLALAGLLAAAGALALRRTAAS